MWVPTLRGLIDRRILVNYRVDPEVLRRLLPPPFRPHVVRGFGLAGVCLIRMARLRPSFVPFPVPVLGRPENGALRFAVEWEQDGELRAGVYIPRRFSDSQLVALAGGRLFPGVHTLARFQVEESGDAYRVEMTGELNLVVQGRAADQLAGSVVFDALDEASAFYRSGSVGYSDSRTPGEYEGLEFRIADWTVRPMTVDRVACDFFDDPVRFPPGAAAFDNALLMREVPSEFHGRGPLSRLTAVR
jgi:hypothetical protein